MVDLKVLCTGGSGFIGSHLCAYLIDHQMDFINLDTKSPANIDHRVYWRECDILDTSALNRIFSEYDPTHVIHLAARADMGGSTLADFRENTIGTENILRAIHLTTSIRRVIITSTQHVFRPNGRVPHDEFEYDPLGLYGQSKVITEKLTHESSLQCCWTIVRPTTIWGPGHPHLADGLWRIMMHGQYIHPKSDPVIRCYGYVKNTAWQIMSILGASPSLVNGKTLYLGDSLMKQFDWINAFHLALTGRSVKVVPKSFIRLLATIGDVLGSLKISFPMQSERYRNLTTSNPVSIAPIIEAFGNPPYSFEEALAETCEWLQSRG